MRSDVFDVDDETDGARGSRETNTRARARARVGASLRPCGGGGRLAGDVVVVIVYRRDCYCRRCRRYCFYRTRVVRGATDANPPARANRRTAAVARRRRRRTTVVSCRRRDAVVVGRAPRPGGGRGLSFIRRGTSRSRFTVFISRPGGIFFLSLGAPREATRLDCGRTRATYNVPYDRRPETTRTTATTRRVRRPRRTASNKLVESRQNGQCRRDVFARAAVAVSVSPLSVARRRRRAVAGGDGGRRRPSTAHKRRPTPRATTGKEKVDPLDGGASPLVGTHPRPPAIPSRRSRVSKFGGRRRLDTQY